MDNKLYAVVLEAGDPFISDLVPVHGTDIPYPRTGHDITVVSFHPEDPERRECLVKFSTDRIVAVVDVTDRLA